MFHFAADFADIYEVRGMKCKARGHDLTPEVTDDRVVLGYRGLDGVVRRTRLHFEPRPSRLTSSAARLDLSLRPQQEATFFMTLACDARSGQRHHCCVLRVPVPNPRPIWSDTPPGPAMFTRRTARSTPGSIGQCLTCT